MATIEQQIQRLEVEIETRKLAIKELKRQAKEAKALDPSVAKDA